MKLKTLVIVWCTGIGKDLPEKWATRRPEELRPPDFLELTADLYGEVSPLAVPPSTDLFTSPWGKVWRGGVADNKEDDGQSFLQ